MNDEKVIDMDGCGVMPWQLHQEGGADLTANRTAQKEYLEKVPEYRHDLHVLDTRVRIEKGIVVEINRHWIP